MPYQLLVCFIIYWFGPKGPKEDFQKMILLQSFRTKNILFTGIHKNEDLKKKACRYSSNLQLCQISTWMPIFHFSRLPQTFDSKLQQTNTKTVENNMPFQLYFPNDTPPYCASLRWLIRKISMIQATILLDCRQPLRFYQSHWLSSTVFFFFKAVKL